MDGMKKPRRVEYEFAGFKEGETYIYWQQYAEALEAYIKYLENKLIDLEDDESFIR